jgi:hypothetical protein
MAHTKRLSDEELGEMLGLVEDADSVELKLTVPHSDHRTVVGALGLDPLDAEIRQVYFFDTPDLSLSKGGLVVRARRVQGKGDDTVVKLRPVVPDQLPKKLRNARGFGVEVDAMPGGFVCSASMKSTAHADVRETVAGARPLSKLFSKEQQGFFAEHAAAGIELDNLSVLGPILVLKLKFQPEDLRCRLVAELWLYPDDSRILELSTKCVPAESFQVATEVRVFLNQGGCGPVRRAGDKDAEGARVLLESAEAGTGPVTRSALPPCAQATTVAVARTGPGLSSRRHVLLHRHPEPPVLRVVEAHDARLTPDQSSVLAPIAQLAARLSKAREIGADLARDPLRLAGFVLPVDVGHGPPVEFPVLVSHDLGKPLIGVHDHLV